MGYTAPNNAGVFYCLTRLCPNFPLNASIRLHHDRTPEKIIYLELTSPSPKMKKRNLNLMKSPHAPLLVAKNRHPRARLTHKNQASNRHLSRRFILPGALVLALVAVVGSAASFGPSLGTPPATEHPAAAPSKTAAVSRPSADSGDGQTHAALSAHAIIAPLTAAFQLPPEEIESFGADCTTPKTSFSVGDTVCAKVSGSQFVEDGQLGPRRVYWVNPEGGVIQDDLVTWDEPTATRVVSARGAWRLYLVSGLDGTLRKVARFSVSDAANPSVDLSVENTIDRRISSFAAGHSITYLITVANKGPNAADDVVFTEQAPNNSTFSESNQISGLAFNCARSGSNTTCSIESLPAGAVAEFAFVYTVISGTPGGTEISSTATVASNTEELHLGDNSSTAVVSITGEVTATECALECPGDLIVTADITENGQPDGRRGALVTFGAAEPVGECGALTTSIPSGSFFPVGAPTTVTVTSEQGGGSCSFTVTVIDAPTPDVTCPPDQTVAADPGELEASVSIGTATAINAVTVTGTRNDNRALTDTYPVGTTIITWTASDRPLDEDGRPDFTGRTDSCQQRIVVTSNDAPTISCPSDKSFEAPAGLCEVNLTAAQIGTPQTTGNGVTVEAVRSDRRELTDPFSGGETVITWTATDSVGRVVSCAQTITVKGGRADIPPVLEVPPDVEAFTSSCSAHVDDELGVASATGGCGGPVKIKRTGIPTRTIFGRTFETFIFPVGTTVITYTATDSSGNTTTKTQRVVVKENTVTPPTVQAPPDVTLYTGAGATSCGLFIDDSVLGTATANDNCPNVTVSRSGVPAGNTFPVGVNEVTYTATDASGNTASAKQKVTVIDDTPPTIALNGADPLTVECHTSFTDPGATVTDACPLASSEATATGSVDVNTPGTYTIIYTASDAAGNDATPVTRTVNVVDTTPPVITLSGDNPMTVECHTGFTDPGATASDGCTGNLTSAIVVTGSVNPDVVGSYTLTYTVSDGPNTTTVNRVVNVVDTTAPVIACPANIVVYLPLNTTAVSMPVNYAVTATDSCASASNVNVVSTPASGSVFPVGTTTVNSTATDPSGNSSSCSFTVTVLYNFTGFFSPVSNLPVLNNVNAGRAIPLKFSLSGNKGLGIFFTGFPASQLVACNTSAPIAELEGTETSGNSTLTYEAGSDQYHYNWKTEKAWAGTCRVLVVKLNDGSTHTANFKFK
jgi:uncharacterized repeat protein (TIGR01451 family)